MEWIKSRNLGRPCAGSVAIFKTGDNPAPTPIDAYAQVMVYYAPFSRHGDIAQLVERLNGIEKVRGSTPLISTIPDMRNYKGFRAFRSARRPVRSRRLKSSPLSRSRFPYCGTTPGTDPPPRLPIEPRKRSASHAALKAALNAFCGCPPVVVHELTRIPRV